MFDRHMMEKLFDIIPFGIYVADVKTYEILFMNDHLLQQRGNYVGLKCYAALYQYSRPCDFCKIKELINDDGYPLDNTLVYEAYNEVEEQYYQSQAKCILWEGGKTAYYSIAVNVTELKQVQNELAEAHAELAIKNRELEVILTTDKLTGIANRLKLEESLEKALYFCQQHQEPFSIIMLNIDHFKTINETHGHQIGDSVLSYLAKLLTENAKTPVKVGRWGGEEFLLICPGYSQCEASVLAGYLQDIISHHLFPIIKHATCSFGIAEHRAEEKLKNLLARADDALHRTQHTGKNRIQVSP